MSRVIHHWPIRKNLTAVAVATALPKEMIIPKMRREIPSTGHCKEIDVGKFKGPPWRAFFMCAGHVRQLGGGSPLPILTEEKG